MKFVIGNSITNFFFYLIRYCRFISIANMKSLISIIILSSTLILNGREKFEIYFNVNDCVNCNNIIRITKSIDTEIVKFFYLTKDNSPIVEEIFKNLDLQLSDFKVNYLPNDFFLCNRKDCRTSVLASYCIFFDEVGKKDSFSLKELPEKIMFLKKNKWKKDVSFDSRPNASNDSIYSSTSNLTYIQKLNNTSLLIPDSIKISKRATIFIKDSIVNILDQLLNKNITLFLNTNFSEIKRIVLVKINDLDPKLFIAANCFDTTFYKGLYPWLKTKGMHTGKLQSTFITDTTINLMLNLSYGRYPDPSTQDSLRLQRKEHPLTLHDTIVDMRFFIYTKNFKTNRLQMQCISETSYEKNKYWLLGLPFFIDKNKLFASVHSWDNPNSDIFLGEFKKMNNQFVFNRLHTNTTKNIQIEHLRKNQIPYRDANSNFYFGAAIPFFYDFRKNEDFLLDKNDFNLNEKIFIRDVFRDGNTLCLLVSEGDQIFRYTFNYNTKKREDKKLLDLQLPAKEINIKFLEANKYIMLDGDKLQILTN